MGKPEGGCHVLLTDEAVKFITDSIESGNQSLAGPRLADAGTPSPYGLWGKLGTRASKEEIAGTKVGRLCMEVSRFVVKFQILRKTASFRGA